MIFAAEGQLKFFCVCFCVGVVSCVSMPIIALLRGFTKNKIWRFLCDLCCFLITCSFYCFANARFCFPNVRAYMILAVILGGTITFFIVYKPLAKMENILYNTIYIYKISRKKKRKDGKRKGKKISRCIRFHGGSVSSRIDDGCGLSNDLPCTTKKGIRSTLRRRS